jgi:hypothetical protein
MASYFDWLAALLARFIANRLRLFSDLILLLISVPPIFGMFSLSVKLHATDNLGLTSPT